MFNFFDCSNKCNSDNGSLNTNIAKKMFLRKLACDISYNF